MNDHRGETPTEHLQRIVDCRLNEHGECVKHQPSPWNPRQKGCPLVAVMLRGGGA